MMTKAELRKHFKALRDGCPAGDRAAWSLRACAHLADFCAGRGIQRVGAFAPFGSEVDLRPLQDAAPGLTFYFPRVASLDPPRLTWGTAPLAPGTWGLLEPVDAPHAQPPVQLLLVPGLAFAADGHRLGYGKGFYDAVLAALPEQTAVLAVGFELQRCPGLPAGPLDRPVQGLVTEAGLSWIPPAARSAGEDRPLVSIIIANYNYARFLGEAIQSALDQTWPEVEIILVDDGSKDDSLEVASRYPIRIFPKENRGVGTARNFGAAQSRGAYMLFLDSDDKLEPQAVEHLLAALRAAPGHVGYAYCQLHYFGNQEFIFPSRPFSHRSLLSGTYVNVSALIRRSVFEAVGGWDPTWRLGHEDAELWVRMLHHGYHGVLVPEPLQLYRCHGPSRNSLDARQKEHLRWRMILTYPGLFWRKLLKHPFKSLYLHHKLGEMCKRHGPAVIRGEGK